jgi:hypothetical protein
LKALLPLALADSIRGMTTLFKTPSFIMGFNVFPEGLVIGPSAADFVAAIAPKKRAFVVADAFSEKFAVKTADYFARPMALPPRSGPRPCPRCRSRTFSNAASP